MVSQSCGLAAHILQGFERTPLCLVAQCPRDPGSHWQGSPRRGSGPLNADPGMGSGLGTTTLFFTENKLSPKFERHSDLARKPEKMEEPQEHSDYP